MPDQESVLLTIDTCVWIELVKLKNAQPILDSIEKMIEEGTLGLAIPEETLKEYLRNKPALLDNERRRATEDIRRVKDLVRSYSVDEDATRVASKLDEVVHQLPSQSDIISRAASRVENLLSVGAIISPSSEVISRCGTRALEKEAPFHNNKNNFADAVIVETFFEVISARKRQAAMFISYNTKEFSDPKDNRRHHSDLDDIFSRPEVVIRTDLLAALREIDGELIESAMLDFEWDQPSRGIGELLSAESSLTEQMWYGRHCGRVDQIARGELKVVGEEEYEGTSDQMLKTIWDGAMKSAERVAERNTNTKGFGDWDDFEWGMLNGKISALRWMLGEEWDELYT